MTVPGTIGVYDTGGVYGNERDRIEAAVHEMETHRQSMLPWFRELGSYFSPRSPRIDIHKENRGNGVNRHILDETAIFARRTLASGLHWGITNPSRQWKVLTIPDHELAENPAAKEWTHETNVRMDTILGGSNFYDTMAMTYDDVITYANAAFIVEEDEEDVIRCVPLAPGSYGLADDARGNVTAVSRHFLMTVRQLVERFGTDARGQRSDARFSQRVKDAIQRKRWNEKVEVVHFVCPNAEYDGVRDTPDAKRWASYYFEKGSKPLDGGFLAKEGYSEWPVMVFRWRKVPDDPFGVDCPAMQILGTNKSVQKIESKALKLVDKAVDPALVGPTSLATKRVSLLPGDLTTDDEGAGTSRLRAIHDVRLEGLAAVREAQGDMRARIEDAFYTRLMTFVLSTVGEGGQKTATEIQEVSNEKYLVFGTVLESFNRTFSQLIDRVFAIMLRRGLLPDAPEIMQGVPLRVEYTSIMAQAQKSVGLSNIERYLATVANLAQVWPEMAMKVDGEQAADEIGMRSGIPPRLVRSDDEVAEIRRAQAEQQRAMQEAEQAKLESEAARNLSQSPVEGDNALSRVLEAGGRSLPSRVTGGRA